MLSSLGLEASKLSRDIAVTMAGAQSEVQKLLQNLAANFAGVAGSKAAAQPAAGGSGNVTQAVGKLVFISVLQEAIDKASKSQHFNVETAINDLWNHLDSARKFATSASSAGPTPSVGSSIELQKLQNMMSRRADMFRALSNVMQKYDQTAKSVIQNMR
jgi:hypothetical protein